MTFRGRYLSRRTMLRGMVGGAALSLALPPLEAMLRLNGAWADGLDSEPFFGVFFWANGTRHAAHGAEQAGMNRADLWTPATVGDNYAPSELLAPLANHRVSVITGLEPHTEVPRMPAGQSDGHMRGFMVAMTGDRPKPEGFDHPSHTLTSLRGSLDQYVARHPSFTRSPAPFRSIEAGASRARFHGYGHWNAISYNGSDSTNLPLNWARCLTDSSVYGPITRLRNVVAGPSTRCSLTRRASDSASAETTGNALTPISTACGICSDGSILACRCAPRLTARKRARI